MDREKVINGLKNISREIINTLGHGEAIPYMRTIYDAIALLKEQEAEIYKLQKELNYWQYTGIKEGW